MNRWEPLTRQAVQSHIIPGLRLIREPPVVPDRRKLFTLPCLALPCRALGKTYIRMWEAGMETKKRAGWLAGWRERRAALSNLHGSGRISHFAWPAAPMITAVEPASAASGSILVHVPLFNRPERSGHAWLLAWPAQKGPHDGREDSRIIQLGV
jgi:hypothetical protein